MAESGARKNHILDWMEKEGGVTYTVEVAGEFIVECKSASAARALFDQLSDPGKVVLDGCRGFGGQSRAALLSLQKTNEANVRKLIDWAKGIADTEGALHPEIRSGLRLAAEDAERSLDSALGK